MRRGALVRRALRTVLWADLCLPTTQPAQCHCRRHTLALACKALLLAVRATWGTAVINIRASPAAPPPGLTHCCNIKRVALTRGRYCRSRDSPWSEAPALARAERLPVAVKRRPLPAVLRCLAKLGGGGGGRSSCAGSGGGIGEMACMGGRRLLSWQRHCDMRIAWRSACISENRYRTGINS